MSDTKHYPHDFPPTIDGYAPLYLSAEMEATLREYHGKEAAPFAAPKPAETTTSDKEPTNACAV